MAARSRALSVPKTQPISPARRAAFDVLSAVVEGAYASDSLLVHAQNLDSRDAGLASQIVFGCLRFQAQLDRLISLFSGRNAAQLDPAVAVILRSAIFQLRYLDRIPAHAAVNDSVELAKRYRRAASGLVNAVLRKVDRRPVQWPSLGIKLSCPGWMIERWTAHFGADLAGAIAAAALLEPVSYIRIPTETPPRADLKFEPTAVPGCYRLLSGLPAGMRLQDIGSQAILPLLDLQPGQTLLDLCAAPGNKTLQALETPLSLAIACDVSPARISQIPAICPRVVLDATCPLPFSRQFDRIFIDAPCSGTGTLSRNPEIKWRVKPEDFTRFQEKQAQIVQRALPLLAPGGKLLYATCSLEREENEDVVLAALAGTGFRCESQLWRVPGRDEGDGFYAALITEGLAQKKGLGGSQNAC